MRNIRYIGNSAINKAYYPQTGIVWTPGKVDTVLDDKVAAEMLLHPDVFEDAGDSFAVNSGAVSLDPTTGAMQIGGAAPTSAQRASVLDALGGPGIDKAYQLPSICILGDSMSRDSQSGVYWTNWGWITPFRRMVYGRALVLPQNVIAVATIGVSNLNSVQVPLAIASGCKIACVMIGTNDVGTNDIVAGLETAYTALIEAGITVIASPILPHSTPSSFSAENRKIVDRVNQYIANKAATTRGMVYAPTLQYMTDFATGDALTGMLRDGVHTSPSGAFMAARGFYDAADKILPPASRPILVASNSYDATTNPYGDIMQNGLMLGTGGSVRLGATGDVPTNWFGQRSNGGSATTIAFTKETEAGTGINKSVSTLGGTGDGAYVGLETNGLVVPAGAVAGSVLELSAYAEWAGLENVLSIYGRLRGTDGTTISDAWDGYYNNGNGTMDFMGDGAAWISVRYTIPAGMNALLAQLNTATKSGAAVAGVVKFSQAGIRPVP